MDTHLLAHQSFFGVSCPLGQKELMWSSFAAAAKCDLVLCKAGGVLIVTIIAVPMLLVAPFIPLRKVLWVPFGIGFDSHQLLH